MSLWHSLKLLSFCALVLLFSNTIVMAEEAAPVVVTETADTATLANGIVTAIVKKSNGKLISLQFRGVEMISRGGGYWNFYGQIPGEPFTEEMGTPSTWRITQDPTRNGGAMGEIAMRFPYSGQAKTVPLDLELRYTLHRGDSGIYSWGIAEHVPNNPAFEIGVGTLCLKLNPDVFDFLSIDAKRQRLMPSAEDWVKGTQLNMWEARRINTGVHKDEVEHKYDYNSLFSKMPAWGWSSTKKNVGIYIVNPTLEFINGGPVGVDYGGHIDVKASLPADPTLLFIWHSPHYGGRPLQIKPDDQWKKILGPFLIYCNSGDSPQSMWKDALERAPREQKAWPYAWAEAPGYDHAEQRGSATGRLVIHDPQAPDTNASGAWMGLAHEPYPENVKKAGAITIDWQTDGKYYQYWSQADSAGHFTIPNVRPGTYVLYAFTDGVLGDFSRVDVKIEAGKTVDLGELVWTPVRYGKQLWEIGIPNRSAEEFLHGDHYWQWGLYNLYPQEFPNDVNYIVGKSDFHHDWNYVQPPKPNGKGGWMNTTWKIQFDAEGTSTGTATLRLAICGVRGGPVDVSINGKAIGSTGELPDSGVMHRDGIRSSTLTERNLKFDASLLKAGTNIIELTKHVRAWTDGVLYDYLRLELDSEKVFVP